MEFPATIDASAKLANSEIAMRACMAVLNARRAYPPLFSDDDKLDGDDLAELFGSAPVPEPAPAPRRQRKRTPSLTKALREAKKAGISVAGATFAADGSVSLSFGEKSNGNDLDQWLAGRHESPTKRR
jgi:hypothetical protein